MGWDENTHVKEYVKASELRSSFKEILPKILEFLVSLKRIFEENKIICNECSWREDDKISFKRNENFKSIIFQIINVVRPATHYKLNGYVAKGIYMQEAYKPNFSKTSI